MRILKTTQTYHPYLTRGGPPAKVKSIASALVRRGHDVTVLTADFGGSDGDHDLRGWERERGEWGWESRNNGVEGIYLSTLTQYRATTINPGVADFCAQRLDGYDLVHIYGLYDLIGARVARFCRNRGIPYVLEPLGMFGPKIRSRLKKRLYGRLVGNALFDGAHAVIATSASERTELIGGGIAFDRIVLRRNGLDLSEFQTLPAAGGFRASLGIDEKLPLLLFLGRLSWIKGLDLLVQAFSKAGGEARLVIAGPNDRDGSMEKVQALIDDLHLCGRVIQSPPLFGREKLQAFVDTDLFVLPSRYESFGNAAAESIACGTPVLVTEKCGIASLVDGLAGLVTSGDIEGIAGGISLLLNNKTLLGKLRKGCDEVARNLSWNEPVEAMEILYASLVQPHETRK